MRLRNLLLCVLFIAPLQVFCWGFFGHKKINRIAVFTLPTELMAFYKTNVEFVSQHAVDPDMRRYAIAEEAPRHYIDIDHYGDHPFETVPRKWDSAVAKFSVDTLMEYGIVPWHIERMYYRLVDAFKKEDALYILKTSADIGHYIADAHVPLHTTENYNGQLTGQHGIHGFWESRLPELYSKGYDFFTGKARLIADPLDMAWDAVEKSHSAVDSVLEFEHQLNDDFASDRKYAFEERGASTVKTYSKDYSLEYHVRMDGMVERRMRASIIMTGSIWYSAWIEAGQPDLNLEITDDQKKQEEARFQELKSKRSTQKIFGRAHE